MNILLECNKYIRKNKVIIWLQVCKWNRNFVLKGFFWLIIRLDFLVKWSIPM